MHPPCSSQLTDGAFTIGDTEFSFSRIRDFHDANQDRLEISFDQQIQSPPQDLKFCIGATAYDFPDTAFREHAWTADVGWSNGDTVSLSIATSCSQPPAAPTDLDVTAGDGRLDLAWTAPSGTVTGYDVHYTSSSTVDADADLATDENPATGWVDADHAGTTASHAITGLTNDTSYRLRVRAANAAGASGWLSGVGAPRRAVWTVTLSAAPNPVAEGASVTVTATVSQPITGGAVARIPLTVTDGTAEPGDRGTASEIRIRRNQTTGSVLIATAHDADSDDETFTVAIDTDNLPAALAAGSPGSVEITIRDDEGSSPLPTLVSQDCPESGRVWSATMTVGDTLAQAGHRYFGYLRSHPSLSDMGALTRSRFAYRNAAVYGIERIIRIVSTSADTNGNLSLRLTGAYTEAVAATLALHAGGEVFRFADAVQGPDRRTLTWRAAGLDWMTNEHVGLCLTDTVVTLSYNDPVYEGQDLRLTATVPHPLTDAVTIPVHITDYFTGQETTLDDGFPGITIPADAASGTGTILMPHDEDTVAESLRVKLGALPAPLAAGNPTLVHVHVYDDDEPVLPAEATLRALRNPVAEGLRAQVRLALSHALDEDVTIPVTVTRGTSEDGDHGTLENIEVPAGDVYGYAHIWTKVDADTGDETFTVALDAANLPAGVKSGSPASVEVTIADDGEAREPPAGTPTVSLYAHPNPVAEGSTVRVRARLSSLLADDVTIPLVVTGVSSEAGDHGTLGSITIPFGFLEAIGEIETAVVADTDDETFTVALDTANLPDGVAAAGEGSLFGGPSETVTIADDGASGQQQVAGVSAATDRPPVAVHRYAALIAQMVEWRNDPRWRMYRSHTARWDRALLAFGETVSDASLTPMTAAEAQVFADRGMTRWVGVAQALRQIESGGVRAAAPPTPVVTIAAGGAVTEGAPAGFTLTAAPAPASDLDVTVTVGQEGAFVHASTLGAHTVTIVAGGTSGTLELLTMDDAADEPDGSVVATLASGAGYALGAAKRARVAVADDDEPVPAVVTKRAIAREGSDEAVVFTVRLDRAAPETVTVDYATADGAGSWARVPPATAGADYTAASGTLTFAPGETSKTIAVPILDDAVDEGMEYFLLRFSRPQGATLADGERETQGLIRNDDHLQAMWLARFGRTVGTQVTDAVSERLQGGLAPGAHATLAGQRVDLSKADDGKALAETLTGLARTFGAPDAQANDDEDDPFVRHGLSDPWNDSATATTARSVTGRELLLGSAFHVAGTGEGSGPALAAWGRVAQAGFDGEHADDTGRTRVDGEVLTGVLGADADFGRLLAGVAVSLSEGEGRYDSPGVDRGKGGRVESTMTTVSPYARFEVTERVSAWGLAGWGTGDMTIRFDDGSMAPLRTDLVVQLGAVGARGELLEQDEAGGMDLALKADAFFVRTESEQAANSTETSADASRVRLVLEGGRAFDLGGGTTVRPGLELGVRHDGGDAETGTGLELGGGIAFADADSGLSIEARARMLVAHADSDYREWGASATARLDPGARGRGLSFALSPTLGATSSAAERLWGARDARGLAPGGEFEAARGLTAEAGYGMALFGGGFTGTPNFGLGLADGGARDWRLGWRLTSAVEGDPGFEVNLDAVRREAADDAAPEHGVMLRGTVRW